jgi:PEP-CTERM motif
MSNKGFLATVAAAALASVVAISQAHAAVAVLPGTPELVTPGAAPDPFKMIFDENGNAIIAIWNGTSYDPYTILKPIGGAAFLTWTLPQLVVPGDVSFAEPPTLACTSASNCSDGLRFTNNGVTSTMSFFSDVEPGQIGGPLADRGFPTGFDFTTFAFSEIGPENGLNGFIYDAGPGDPSLTNVYTGISDTVPEASTWAMMIVGFVGLAFAAYRRARVSASFA